MGIRFHDCDEEESGNDDDDVDEVRELIGIEFQKKKQGKSKKGYKVTTALVVEGEKVDDSDDMLQPYEINGILHDMITGAVTPKYKLFAKPAAP